MNPLESKFFPRGGFSSSHWNHIEKVNDADTTDIFYQNNSNQGEKIMNQNKSRRGHQKFNWGFST